MIGMVENTILFDHKLIPVTIDHFEERYLMNISNEVVNRSSNLSRFNTIPNGSEKGAGGILQKEAINKIAPSIEKRL
jgi:hypothetical protein